MSGYASNASSDVTAMTTAFYREGFSVGDPIPVDQLSWLLQQISGGFTDPADAIGYTAAGGSVMVAASDHSAEPGTEQASPATGTTNSYAVDCDGQYCVFEDTVSGNSDAYLVSRDALATTLVTYQPTARATTSILYIVFDGFYVCTVGQNGDITLFTASDGTLLWTYSHGAAVNAVTMDGTYVYIGGAAGTGTKDVRAIHMTGGSAGTAAWSYYHNSTVRGLTRCGRRIIFYSSSASGHASGATMRAVNADNGNDAANEGGTAADTEGLAWDYVHPTTGTLLVPSAITSDGRRLYLAYNLDPVHQVEVRTPVDGEVVQGIQLPFVCSRIVVDQSHVYVLMLQPSTDAYISALTKTDLVERWRHRIGTSGYNPANAIASDGFRVYAATAPASGNDTRIGVYRGNSGPALCRAPESTDRYRPYLLRLIPQEGS